MTAPIETDKSKDKLFERIKNTSAGANEKLMMQADFYADAICEFMPFPPDVWTGATMTKGKLDSNHLRMCWSEPRTEKYIELVLSDSSCGSLWVDGNRTDLKWIATETGAREAFESAFRYIFGAVK